MARSLRPLTRLEWQFAAGMAILIWCACAPPRPTALNFNGDWDGTTSQGRAIRFSVQDLRIIGVTVEYSFGSCTGSVMPTHDRFQASGLYSYKLQNDYLGPYVRASMRTRIFPGYIYFENPADRITLNIVDSSGATVWAFNPSVHSSGHTIRSLRASPPAKKWDVRADGMVENVN